MTRSQPAADPVERLRSPLLAVALAPPALLVGALLAPADAVLPALVMPSSLAGLLAPVAAYRFYHHRRERLAAGADRARRVAEFRLATLTSSSITTLAALFGVTAFWLSGSAMTLVGVAMHALVCGALWPTAERLERFLLAGRD